ncbi:transcriptional regulator with XRE-family HTH domain [Bradyrhizobium sp. USDA 4341]
MFDLIEIGTQVRANRKAMKLSRDELAASCRVHRNTIASLETGNASAIQVNLLLRIMNAVGLDLRATVLNGGRPTLEDVARENIESEEEVGHAPRMG